MNNRQRRAAKARAKARERARRAQPRGDDDYASDEQFAAGAPILALRHLVTRSAEGWASMADRESFLRHPDAHQQEAVDDLLTTFVRRLFDAGWSPLDLNEVTRRKHDPDIVARLMSVVATETGRCRPELVHPTWAAQVTTLVTIRTEGCLDWAYTTRISWPAARRALIDLLIGLCSLPVVEATVPAPGHAQPTRGTRAGVDERALRRVRALLAKAEGTPYPDEAEALTAKAQQLMTSHAIERTLAESAQPAGPTPGVRRIWLDAPYTSAKSLLLAAVAGSNHARSIFHGTLGFVTVVGFERDLVAVELLTTSLLVQATRAMTASGPHRTRTGQSRTRSFRQAFLVAYATRIGERLRESAAGTESAADAQTGGGLLPVLAARDDRVRDTYAAMFPNSVTKEIGVSNSAGWGAGRAAADLALFDVFSPLIGQTRAS